MDELDLQILALAEAELAGAPGGLQEVEGELQKMLLLRQIETASGVQLDGIGAIAGLLRASRTDAEYRAALRIQIAVNNTRGSAAEVIDAAADMDAAITEVMHWENHPASWELYLRGSALTEDQRILLRAMAREGIEPAIVSTGDSSPMGFGPDSGWHIISSFSSSTVAVLAYDVSDYFRTGDEVRVWRFSGEGDSIHEDYVLSVSTTNVTLRDGIGSSYSSVGSNLILENVSRGTQDETGDGVTDAFAISGIDPGTNRFSLTGDVTAWFPSNGCIRVIGSTANDGLYKLASVVLDNGTTYLTTVEHFASSALNGYIYQVNPDYASAVNASLGDCADAPFGNMADEFRDLSPA